MGLVLELHSSWARRLDTVIVHYTIRVYINYGASIDINVRQ